MPFSVLTGQLEVAVELRPRLENRHGFGRLFGENDKATRFVSQRTRANIDYKAELLDVYLSFQNVRVWEDVPQLNKSNENGLALHQAWARWKINQKSAFKIGRQEFVYDNSRILGNVGWAQQARSHDALLFTTTSPKTKFHRRINSSARRLFFESW